VGSTLNLTVPPGGATLQSQSGNFPANVLDGSIIDHPIVSMLKAGNFPPHEYVIFITFNALQHDAFGYHAAGLGSNQSQECVRLRLLVAGRG
jgi:hypothetical protein